MKTVRDMWALLAAGALLAGCGGAAAPASTASSAGGSAATSAKPAASTAASGSPKPAASSAASAGAKPAASSGAGSAAAKPAASAAAKPGASGGTQVKIAIAGANIIESSADLARQDGNYQRHGVDATITRINGSVNTMAAIQSGEIQIAQTTTEAVLLGQSKNLPLLAIAPINIGFTQSLIFSNKWLQAHPVPSGASIAQRAALLNGATLGQVSATDEIVVKNFLKVANLPANAAKFVKMQNQEAQLAALKQAEIDAISLSAPESFEAEAQGLGKIILNSRDIPKWNEVPYIVAFTTRQYAKDHPDAVKGTLAGMEEAMAKMVAGGQPVMDFEKKTYPNYSDEVLKKSLDFVDLAPYKPFTADMFSVEAQILTDSGSLTSPFSPKEGTDWSNEFVPPKPS